MQREFATNTGVIAYEVIDASEPPATGATPTLTLLHNFMSSGRSAWGPLLPTLSQRYRLLLPDLPGHGASVGHPTGFHHWAIARQLAALMRAEGAATGHLTGCSSGGMIAQLLVHHKLVQPTTLTLISTTHSTNRAVTGAEQALTPENFEAGRKWMEATARLHDPHQGDGYYERVLLPAFRALRPDTAIDLPLEALEAFALPVCLIHGARDEFFPVALAKRMAAALPDAQLHVIPNQTHALIFRQPWQVAEIMADFLARN
jgi:pimeloyl-ACP methyl ester carboxylesterase